MHLLYSIILFIAFVFLLFTFWPGALFVAVVWVYLQFIQKVPKESIGKTMAKTKIITETRHTCNVCGKVWHYGKQEQLQNFGNAMSNAGKGMMCCTGCVPAVFIPDKKVADLNKCPDCGSKNIRKEQIVHEVAK